MRLAKPFLCLALLVPPAAIASFSCGGQSETTNQSGSSSGSSSGQGSSGSSGSACLTAPVYTPQQCNDVGLTCVVEGGGLYAKCACESPGTWSCKPVNDIDGGTCPDLGPLEGTPCSEPHAMCNYANSCGPYACECQHVQNEQIWVCALPRCAEAGVSFESGLQE
jgi:hypothetical protein